MADDRMRRRRRASESMWTRSTHAAQTLVPSVLSTTALQMLRRASTCCGTRWRIMPVSSSPLANSFIDSKNECWDKRVGSACEISRAEVATMKTF